MKRGRFLPQHARERGNRDLRTLLRTLPNVFRARSCSESMGYEHTIFRCWWDSRVIVHYGPLWWMCSECRQNRTEFGITTLIPWRELPSFYWDVIVDSSLSLWLRRRQQCCLSKKSQHKMDCSRSR